MHVNKILLSPLDSKRWIAEDGIHTNAYGYAPAFTEAELLAATFVPTVSRSKINVLCCDKSRVGQSEKSATLQSKNCRSGLRALW